MTSSLPQWHFRDFKPGDNASDPDFARALFSRDESAIARSLVREAIQNSLDARRADASAVRVRFTVRAGRHAIAAASAQQFLSGAWPHIQAGNSGLEEPPSTDEPIAFLAVEDFGTKGLTGNPTTWDPFDAIKNSFFLFFRALGRSGKEGEDRGRWGVGKFVFPMASRAHCLLALTIPEGAPQPLVMGRMVLKTHRADNVSYHPDGHWGYRDTSPLVLPKEDIATAQSLRDTFSLSRSSEPGLSVVVPWLKEGFTAEAITVAVVGEYFLPILRSELIVEIDDSGRLERIDANRLAALAESLSDPLVRARVALALQAATWPAAQIPILTRPLQSEYDWQEDRVPEEVRAKASTALEGDEVAAFRVPVLVRPKDSGSTVSYFDVFLRHVSGLGRTRPLIVREGITVSEDKTQALQDYVCLVVVDDRALATFVGDAETPAHTELQTDLVKAKYILPGKLIQLLRMAPFRIVQEIEGGDVAADLSLLAEFFPRLSPAPVARRRRPEPATEGDDTEEVPEIPTRAPRFRISRTRDGFAIRGTGHADPGTRLNIQCAYDVRRGNAVRKYRRPDFGFDRDIALATTGLEIEHSTDNSIVAVVKEGEFELTASGFDTNRNVVVRVTASQPEGLA